MEDSRKTGAAPNLKLVESGTKKNWVFANELEHKALFIAWEKTLTDPQSFVARMSEYYEIIENMEKGLAARHAKNMCRFYTVFMTASPDAIRSLQKKLPELFARAKTACKKEHRERTKMRLVSRADPKPDALKGKFTL
jgi:hypothetical protein